jgi:hypothetical protein
MSGRCEQKLRLRLERHHFTIERAAQPFHVRRKGLFARPLLWRSPHSERQATDGARGIVEAETITADVLTRCGRINREGSPSRC